MIKTLRNLFKQDKEKFAVPKSVQAVIPLKTMWEDGIFLVGSGIQFRTLRAKTVEMPDKVSTHTGKIIPRFLDVLLADGDCHIFVLHDGVRPCRLIQKHLVILFTVFI